MADKPSLTINRRLAAPPAKVYAAWTDAAQIARWWGPNGSETLSAESDPRIGGSYRIVFREQDGEEHDVSGIYREVVPNERLVFTWMWRTMPERQSLVTIALRRDGDGTLLTLTHEQFADEPARDRHRQGWGSALDRFESYVAGA